MILVRLMINNIKKGGDNMIRLISKTDGKIAITVLGVASLLLLALFMVPVMRVEAAHCTGGAVTPCTEDVRNTKHNLNANTDIGPITGTTEVCVFCHTPHGAKLTGGILGGGNLPQAPIWNRRINQGGNYQVYAGPNFDAAGTTPGTPKGVSLACLSCHDGTISFDALINAPGSGGFIPNNRNAEGADILAADRVGMTFAGPGVGAGGQMKAGDRPLSNGGGLLGGLNNFVGPAVGNGMEPFPNLTTDLRDDHPISMQMPSTDPQFNDALGNRLANVDGGAGNDGVKISFISRFGAGATSGAGIVNNTIWSQDKRDRIRLYPSVNGEVSQYVECASCHNPHTPRPLFLRLPTVSNTEFGAGTTANITSNFSGGGFGITLVTGAGDLAHNPNQGSLVCLSCHQK